jgi:hypothetical protein
MRRGREKAPLGRPEAIAEHDRVARVDTPVVRPRDTHLIVDAAITPALSG